MNPSRGALWAYRRCLPCYRAGMPSQTSLRNPFLFLLPLAGLVGCSETTVDAAEGVQLRNLLEASPDSTLEVPAILTPKPLVVWGMSGGVGWADRLQEVDGEDCAVTRKGFGELMLKGRSDRDRFITFEVASLGPTDGVLVSFNGVQIAELDKQKELESVEHLIPAPMWVEGANKVRFESRSGEGNIALRFIETSDPQEFDPDEATLDSGVFAEWDVLLAAGGLLEIAGEAEERGLVEVTLESSAFGSSERTTMAQETYQIEAGLPLIARLPIEAVPGSLLRVGVRWEADPGQGKLELSRLGIFEDEHFELPPILFISIDTLSAQNMSIHGYGRETTPRLAGFLADSVMFEQARSNAPWTVPSYASQFTGLYATANRITKEMRKDLGVDAGKQNYRVPASRLTLAEMMRAAGYRTGAFLDNPWLTSIPGLEQGFDIYDTAAAEAPIENGDMGIRYVLPAAHEFIEEGGSRPPFVIAQALDVHGPYHTRPPFQGHFTDGLSDATEGLLPIANTPAPVFGAVPKHIASLRKDVAHPGFVSAELLRADYDEKVYELDTVLGEFFDELRAEGVYDSLLIVLSADHGESMVDHDFYFRHGLVYDSATHVPLIVKLPGQEFAGTRVTTPVQLVDLFPTFADVVGVELDGYSHGRSLLPLIENGQPEPRATLAEANVLGQASLVLGDWKLVASWPLEVALESLLTFMPFQEELHANRTGEFRALFGGAPPIASHKVVDVCAAIKEGDVKIYWALTNEVRQYDPHFELFNIRTDPKELHDLSAEQPERVASMLELLESERARSEAHRKFEDTTGLELSEDKKGALEALGYVTD